MALAVPLSRFTSLVGGGSAFFVRQREFMNTSNPSQKPSRGWILFCRIFICGVGAFFIGYGLYDFIKHGHYLSVLIFSASIGLLLVCLGIFTSDKTCEKIADGITCGF